MRPYLARVEQEWIALGRNHLAGRKRSILSLVTLFAPEFPDLKEAMGQAIEAELTDAGKVRGRKPTKPNGYEDALARDGQHRCVTPGCVMRRMPKRKRCLAHLEKHREQARRWYQAHKQRRA